MSTLFWFVAPWKQSSQLRICWTLYPTASLASLDQILMEKRQLIVSA